MQLAPESCELMRQIDRAYKAVEAAAHFADKKLSYSVGVELGKVITLGESIAATARSLSDRLADDAANGGPS